MPDPQHSQIQPPRSAGEQASGASFSHLPNSNPTIQSVEHESRGDENGGVAGFQSTGGSSVCQTSSGADATTSIHVWRSGTGFSEKPTAFPLHDNPADASIASTCQEAGGPEKPWLNPQFLFMTARQASYCWLSIKAACRLVN
ncbi:MAG: hypothetical protein ACKO26_04985 [Planctomycetota bacterium]